MSKTDMGIYCFQKRLQYLLDIKSNAIKNIQPTLVGEDNKIGAVYTKFFDEIEITIKEEVKFLNELYENFIMQVEFDHKTCK